MVGYEIDAWGKKRASLTKCGTEDRDEDRAPSTASLAESNRWTGKEPSLVEILKSEKSFDRICRCLVAFLSEESKVDRMKPSSSPGTVPL
jgi:hypothetical protein